MRGARKPHNSRGAFVRENVMNRLSDYSAGPVVALAQAIVDAEGIDGGSERVAGAEVPELVLRVNLYLEMGVEIEIDAAAHALDDGVVAHIAGVAAVGDVMNVPGTDEEVTVRVEATVEDGLCAYA